MRWWWLIGLAGCFDASGPPAPPTPTPAPVCETVTPFDGELVSTDAVLPQTLAPMSCHDDNDQMQQVAYRFDVTGGPKGLVIAADSDQFVDIQELALQRTCGDPASELDCATALRGPGYAFTYLELEDVPDGSYTLLATFSPYSVLTQRRPITVTEHPATHGLCSPDGPYCLGGTRCHALTPGAPLTCDPPSCEDGGDNDGDGRTDFPADPGCVSGDDITEEDPAIAPVCADGVDNDGDGNADWPDDTGCKAASDTLELDDCAADVPVLHYPEDWDISGTSSPLAYSIDSHMTAPLACDPNGLSAQGGEAAYGFTIDRPVTKIRFDATGTTTSTDVQTVLYVRTPDCAASSATAACAASSGSGWFHLDLPSPPQGSYVVVAEKLGPPTSGLMTFFSSSLLITAFLPHGAACDPRNGFYACSAPDVCGTTSHICE